MGNTRMFRYMVGDVMAGGCVIAANQDEALVKVKAFYYELATRSEHCEIYKTANFIVWNDGEGFMGDFPDVVEVYP